MTVHDEVQEKDSFYIIVRKNTVRKSIFSHSIDLQNLKHFSDFS